MSNPQNMIIVFQLPNGKSHPDRIEKYKVKSTGKCEGSHQKVKIAVIRCSRNQSQNIVPREALPEINPCCKLEFYLRKLLGRVKITRARKMHSPHPGCYDHVIGEI